MSFRTLRLHGTGEWRFFRPLVGLSILCLLALCTVAKATGSGTITSLTASNSNPSTVSAVVAADGGKKITSSNVTFVITDSNNNVVGSFGPVHVVLNAGETQTITWSWNVNGVGPFTVNACWSPGNSSNCKIDNKTTSFSAVPSLGLVLGGVAVLLVAGWFWYARRQMVTAEAVT